MFFTYIGFFVHPQMSYYICMLIGILFFAELAIAAKAKEWKHFGIATAVFFASFAVGMGMGSADVFVNQEYAEETMRGGHSDLIKDAEGENKPKGLDLDYATAWSYGINETMTFLIPNYMGGASGYNLGKDSHLEQDLKKMGVPSPPVKPSSSASPPQPIGERRLLPAGPSTWAPLSASCSYWVYSLSADLISRRCWLPHYSRFSSHGDITLCP